MGEESVDINVYSQVTIPNAMAELMDNHNKMEQISAYCKSLYANGDTAQAFEQTQGYAKNALLNVAYHIQTVGTHITSLLQLQTNEMEKLNIEIQTLTQRVRMIHDSTGTNVFSNVDAAKPYKSSLKNRKVDVETAKAPIKYVHKQISYGMSAADINTSTSAGGNPPLNHSNSSANLTSSTGHLGSSASNSSTPSYQSPSYQSNNGGVPTSAGTPPPIQAKPPIGVRSAPPPPSLSVPAPPPSMAVPPIPTSQRPPSSGSFDLPPPPPPSAGNGGFDLPPPPSFGLPPPPSIGDHDLPPPPPPPVGSYDFPPPPARPQSQFYSDLPPPPPPM